MVESTVLTAPSDARPKPFVFTGRLTGIAWWPYAAQVAGAGILVELLNLRGLSVLNLRFLDIVPIFACIAIAWTLNAFRAEFRSLALVAEAMGFLFICLFTGALLSEAAATFTFPFRDNIADSIDLSLGYDRLSFLRFVDRLPGVNVVLGAAYLTIWSQGCVILGALALAGERKHIEKLIAVLLSCYVTTILVSIFFPLAGVLTLFPQVRFEHIQLGGGAAAARALAALRSGSLRTIDMNHLQALISMPSFHAIVAAAWCYAAWPLRASFPIVCAINLAMIVSALTVGCHYLCDVVAGACVAAAWIWAIEKLYRGPSVRHMRLAPASQNRNCDKPAAALTL
jgi:membrane-associated phospholipid phosphatase